MSGSGIDGDESVPEWLHRAAETSATPDGALSLGSTLLDGRLRIERRLGAGGMGVVYAAHDRERDETVALKTLNETRGGSIYRIKQEFRALADVSDPHLVVLHGLYEDAGRWFFTMELLSGVDLARWLRRAGRGQVRARRVRAAFAQLARGVGAIHAAGKLHRDLKPSNVMITEPDRVVILDFGLAADPEPGGAGQTLIDGAVAGTPAYMAPEQAAGEAAGPASDLYALGAMLYEALTGELPIGGGAGRLMAAKQVVDPKPPSSRVPGLDPALDDLCARLLAREPGKRPDLPEVLEVLGDGDAPLTAPAPSVRRGPEAPFVGREQELESLRAAFERSRDGACIVTFVPGESGIGKTALVERFAAWAQAERGAVVLSGRCYERERLPYKAFDAVIDALSRHLRRLPETEAALLIPRDVEILTRLFPVLSRVECVARVPRRRQRMVDPAETRRRGFEALAELLGRLADAAPVVIAVDDLQWGDLDSVRLLMALLTARDTPALCFVGTYRSEARGHSEPLEALLEGAGKSLAEVREVPVGPLPEADVAELARQLLPATGQPLADAAAEAHGSPFFLGELAQYLTRGHTAGDLSLDTVLRARLDALDTAERRTLDTLAVSVAPLPRSVLSAAAGAGDAGDVAARLIAARLVRESAGGAERLEPYHDKIREAAIGALDAEATRARHEALASAWSARDDVDPRVLFAHHEGAGELTQAAVHARAAAERAAADLAFAHAAELYSRALALAPPDDDERKATLLAMAEAWSAAGFGARSHDSFLEAAELCSGDERIALRWRAAEQLLWTRNVQQAVPLLEQLLPELGMRLPRPGPRTWLHTASLFVRRQVFEPPRELEPAPPEALRMRADRCWTLQQGFLAMDMDRWVALIMQHRALARDSRDPRAVALALAQSAAFGAMFEGELTPRFEAMLQRAEALASEHGDPETQGWVRAQHGHALGNALRHREAVEAFDQAVALFARGVPGGASIAVSVELDKTVWVAELGRWRQSAALCRRVHELGQARGHMHGIVGTTVGIGTLALYEGDDDRSRELCEHVLAQPWVAGSGFHLFAHLALGRLALARDELDVAAEHVERMYAGVFGRLNALIPRHRAPALTRAAFGWLTPSVALARAEAGIDRRRNLRIARNFSRAYLSDPPPAAKALGHCLQAGMAQLAGDPGRAVDQLRLARDHFVTEDKHTFAAMADRQRGTLLGGDEGRALIDAADAHLRSENVADPERITHVWLPGFRDR